MDRIPAFVEWLKGLDRRAFAELRRSLAFEPGTYPPAYPFVERYIAYEHERWCFYLHAGLFALCAQGEGPVEVEDEGSSQRVPNLSSAVAELYARRDQSPSIEHRFIALLDADEEQLPHRLRQMVALLQGERIHIHWVQLLKDLLAWTHDRRYVQQRWAREFYRVSMEASEPTVGEERSA